MCQTESFPVSSALIPLKKKGEKKNKVKQKKAAAKYVSNGKQTIQESFPFGT
jgi:hypothetical protein